MVNYSITYANKDSDIGLKADLVCFWSRYPQVKFTQGGLVWALGGPKRDDVAEEIESLISDAIIEKNISNGLPCYHLTSDPVKRELILSQSLAAEEAAITYSARRIR